MGWFNWTTGINTSAEYTANQTLTSRIRYVLIDASNNEVSVTLGAAASNKNTIHTIKKVDSSSNTVTIDANSTETIDGELTIELKLQYQYVTIVCDGTEWFIIGGEYVKMEDTLEDLLDEQKDTKEVLEKALLYLVKIQKYQVEEEEIGQDEIEEELKNLIVETSD